MNLIDRTFSRLKEQGKTVFIPFVTVGDPDPDTSLDILQQLELAGADLVELGVPYSDPLADGPVIQRSSMRALRHRITIADCIGTARRARERGIRLPFVLFTYYNPVLQFGLERTFRLMRESDMSGIIIPDLPVEESGEARELAAAHGIHLIPLVAPTSNERIRKITERASGFVYCVSSLGVTGMRSEFDAGVERFLASVRQSTSLPIAIGFGISSHEQVERFSKICDGVVVGSAIVRKIEEAGPLLTSPDRREEGLALVREYVRQLKG
jgi:tryptophan synthase alpha chain